MMNIDHQLRDDDVFRQSLNLNIIDKRQDEMKHDE
jgi:hypothetical protein